MSWSLVKKLAGFMLAKWNAMPSSDGSKRAFEVGHICMYELLRHRVHSNLQI